MPRLQSAVFFTTCLLVFSFAANCLADYTWKDISIPLRKNIKVERSVTINFNMPGELLRQHKKIRLDIITWDLDWQEAGFIKIGDSLFSGYYTIEGDDKERVSDSIEIDVSDLKPGMNEMRVGNRTKPGYWFWIKELKFNLDFSSVKNSPRGNAPKEGKSSFSIDDVNEVFIAAYKTYTKKYPENNAPDSTSIQAGDHLIAIGRVRGTDWYLVRKDRKKAGYMHLAQLLHYTPQHISKAETKKLQPQFAPVTKTQKKAPAQKTALQPQFAPVTSPDKKTPVPTAVVTTKVESISQPVTEKHTSAEISPEPATTIVDQAAPDPHPSVTKGSRVALVIGNSDYAAGRLSNPVNDSDDMAAVLQNLGFDIVKANNVNRREMLTSLNSFSRKLRRAEIGFFYFAGHGMQINGKNFLIPLKTTISTAADVEYEAVNAGRIIRKMAEAGTRLNIVVLDACRNNPFRSLFRSSLSGLARMDVPVGTIIAYATSPGDVAADGLGRNGIYTKHLLESLSVPGLNVQEVFNQAGLGVMKDTDMKQVPWFNSSPMNPTYLAGKKK